MKKLFITFLLLCSFFQINATTKYVWHKMVVKDREFNIIDESAEIMGVVVFTNINGVDYLAISIGKEMMYEIQIVNKVVENPDPSVRIEMLQGGQKIEEQTVAINIFLSYLTEINAEIPEKITIDVLGSTNYIEFSGLVKLE